ncbi:hypothetical protein Mgra_00002654 [Meloidogyne graminicola]|uniref:Uncharacterized protein n=1 Tax=Meloidogyne graminicola TaxID=189291 RepID=A0A8S9ZXE2_9BILA|nr:hypothetical protein Mgra_00002654 [Meloidogyne graminicola]
MRKYSVQKKKNLMRLNKKNFLLNLFLQNKRKKNEKKKNKLRKYATSAIKKEEENIDIKNKRKSSFIFRLKEKKELLNTTSLSEQFGTKTLYFTSAAESLIIETPLERKISRAKIELQQQQQMVIISDKQQQQKIIMKN